MEGGGIEERAADALCWSCFKAVIGDGLWEEEVRGGGGGGGGSSWGEM